MTTDSVEKLARVDDNIEELDDPEIAGIVLPRTTDDKDENKKKEPKISHAEAFSVQENFFGVRRTANRCYSIRPPCFQEVE